MFADKMNIARGVDWIEFKAWLIGHHHKRLAEMLYERGVKGPFCANQPLNGLTGWFPLLQRIYNDDRFVLGITHVDHSGEITLYNAGRMIGNASLYGRWSGTPLAGSLESQASNISGMWSTSAGGSYNIYYRMLVAAGLNFHTPYWFNDGENVPGRGCFKIAHHFESPVDHKGNTRYHYDVIRRVNGFLMKHPEIVTLEPEYNVVLGHCREYDSAARVMKGLSIQTDMGVLRNILVWTDNLFTWVGLEDQPLLTNRPLFVVSYGFLPRIVQEKLVDFVSRGGRLILMGQLPFEDENRRPCKLLATALGVRRVTIAPPTYPSRARSVTMIDMFGVEIISQDPVYEFKGNIEALAVSEKHVVGFEKRLGKGRATVLGFFFRGYTLSERECLCKLLGGAYQHGYLKAFVRKHGRRKLTTYLNLGEEEALAKSGGRIVRVPPKNARFIYFDGKRHHVEHGPERGRSCE
jgi:beta-galactosidase